MAGVKQTAKDYAGLAALVTAIGGIVSMLMSQATHQEHSNNVQDSVFAVLQYRVDQLELRCPPFVAGGGYVSRTSHAPGHPESPPETPPEAAGAPVSGSTTVDVGSAGEGATEDPTELRTHIHKKLKKQRALGMREIRDYVQKTGKALDVDF